MNNTGEYTGTPDDVRRRHEFRYDKQGNLMIDTESLPIHYPIWSDRQWKAVWHAHNKYLRDKKRIADQDKREEDIRTQKLKHSLQGIVAYLISDAARRKDEKHKQVQEQRMRMESNAVLRSGNYKKTMGKINQNKECFSLFSREQLICLWFLIDYTEKSKQTSKAGKKNACIIRDILHAVMQEQGYSIDKAILIQEYTSIPQGVKIECSRMFAQGISRY